MTRLPKRTSQHGVRPTRSALAGFTLVELLAVIAIIGIIIAMLLPAVQAAREAARKMQCRNHLKQWVLAALCHESATGRFPTNGFAAPWIGDPDRGNGKQQRGGWMYNLLPYMEQQLLHDLQLGKPIWSEARLKAATQMIQTPLAVLHCPSRRSAMLYPNGSYDSYNTITDSGANVTATYKVKQVAKNDYAANGGDVYCNSSNCGSYHYSSSDSLEEQFGQIASNNNGIFYPGSQVHTADIEDGMSNTYLLGEKCLSSDRYFGGIGERWVNEGIDDTAGDSVPALVGDEYSNVRWTGLNHTPDLPPRQDRPKMQQPTPHGMHGDYFIFGSAHSGGCNMGFCDGSIRSISYSIDPEIHRCLGNRRDGKLVETSEF